MWIFFPVIEKKIENFNKGQHSYVYLQKHSRLSIKKVFTETLTLVLFPFPLMTLKSESVAGCAITASCDY